jgi:hypothetical protein
VTAAAATRSALIGASGKSVSAIQLHDPIIIEYHVTGNVVAFERQGGICVVRLRVKPSCTKAYRFLVRGVGQRDLGLVEHNVVVNHTLTIYATMAGRPIARRSFRVTETHP